MPPPTLETLRKQAAQDNEARIVVDKLNKKYKMGILVLVLAVLYVWITFESNTIRNTVLFILNVALGMVAITAQERAKAWKHKYGPAAAARSPRPESPIPIENVAKTQ